MRNKKVVRLTESQLHNIIAESVNQILMELDPRTYASYADKRQQQYLDLRKGATDSEKFANQRKNKAQRETLKNKIDAGRQAARDAWNRQYGHDLYQDVRGDEGEWNIYQHKNKMYDGKWEDGKYNPYPTKGYAIRHDIGGKGAGDYCQHF